MDANKTVRWITGLLLFVVSASLQAAITVPPEVQQPGTQPREVGSLESPNRCDNCHGGYNTTVEPAYNWRGSMMANATRDPIFWATVAVAEQSFDGVGDLCIRCHSADGWIGGRSTPTDGSALSSGDADGVSCDTCHMMTNPDNSEWMGVQNSPFIANDLGSPATGFYGGGMYSMWAGSAKLGPFSDAQPAHQFLASRYHRSSNQCGTCHDVSNPVVGDLAHNNGAQVPLAPGAFSGVPGSPVSGKAAFKNFPYQYGVVERTFSEHKASGIGKMLVSQYNTLPSAMKTGAIKAAYDSSIVAGTGGNYADGTSRYFSCQTCHVRPITGQGCNKNPPVRKDLPLHDMTGGNYWMPDAIKYLDAQNKLRVGGGLTSVQQAAMNDGKARAMKQLSEAASLVLSGDTLRIYNLTGHKLISGYPEGRRMWLNVKWYGLGGALLREDGKYGPLTVSINGTSAQVNTILNLEDPNTKIYEAHYAMTQEWASQLVSLGYSTSMPIRYDRLTGAVVYTLGELAAQEPGTHYETFNFALNNTVAKDNRIPPYGYSYDEAAARNALPVPADQYGNPGAGGTYNGWDDIALAPPSGASYATISLMYQPTSWEYVQFLYLANNKQNAFLANEGAYLLEAWQNTGMAAPYVMASTTWGTPPVMDLVIDSMTTWAVNKSGVPSAQTSTFTRGATVAVKTHAVDAAGIALSGVQVFVEIRNASGVLITSLQGFTGTDGNTVVNWKTAKNQAAGTYTARVVNVIKSGYQFKTGTGVTAVNFTVQ